MKILFQGDSITDSGRVRTEPTDMGTGYAKFVKARLSLDYPAKFEFFNRGIGILLTCVSSISSITAPYVCLVIK